MKELTKEWIDKAEKDHRVAKREFYIEEPEYDAVCFHSQQCVEKYIKALLQENNIIFEKTHDLGFLLEKCKKFIPDLFDLKQGLVELSSFAVEIRYPGVEALREDAKDCLSIAIDARNIIRKYFHLNS